MTMMSWSIFKKGFSKIDPTYLGLRVLGILNLCLSNLRKCCHCLPSTFLSLLFCSGYRPHRISCQQFLRQRRPRQRRAKSYATSSASTTTSWTTQWRHGFAHHRPLAHRRRLSSNWPSITRVWIRVGRRCAPAAGFGSSTSFTSAPWRPSGTRRVSSVPTVASS